jgi:murein DD-endopeptidase MepM/ murein hydrolase activator NlpD
LKRVLPQESAAGSHSLNSNEFQQVALGGSRRVQTSAAMLGIAISFGASASLLTEPQAALAVEGTVVTVLPSATDELAEPTVPRLVVSQEDASSTAYHTVEDGDSLWQIAAEHHTDVQLIKSANGIAPDEVLQAGQVIRVPAESDLNAMGGSAGQPRMALATGLTGGVGGDFAADTSDSLPLSVPSVDELEATWESADALTAEAASNDKASAAEAAQSRVAVAPQAPESVVPMTSGVEAATVVPQVRTEAPQSAAVGAGTSSNSVDVATTVPTNATVSASTWQDDAVAFDATSAQAESEKLQGVAFVGDTTADSENSLDTPATMATRIYTVKPGDTFWNIASRHGLSADELLAYNQVITSPEDITVGDNIYIPVDAPTLVASVPNTVVADVEIASDRQQSSASLGEALVEASAQPESVVEATAEMAQQPERLALEPVSESEQEQIVASAEPAPSAEARREAFIQDHLARIRSSANRNVDRGALNARIREARRALEAAQNSGEDISPVALEYYDASTDEAEQAQVQPTNNQATVRAGESSATPTLAASLRSQQAESGWSVTDVATEGETVARVNAPDTAENAIEESSVGGSTSALDQPGLLAAAPLNPDVYRNSPSLPIGATVFPNMPILPESDEFLPETPNRFNGYVWPAQGVLTSGYGWRWGRMHRGIDIAGPVGTPIVAAASGVVVQAGWNSGGYGNLVDIRHADGSMTRYAHNSRLLVSAGQQVRQGQQIAAMGSTGYSTGPHLHFEVHVPNSGTVNPIAYLPGR